VLSGLIKRIEPPMATAALGTLDGLRLALAGEET
jgi:hypothetical protein